MMPTEAFKSTIGEPLRTAQLLPSGGGMTKDRVSV
jgi:hypothetical protein